MCLVYWLRIHRIINELKIDDKLIDKKLVTVDDYTICGNISPDFYQAVIQQYAEHSSN